MQWLYRLLHDLPRFDFQFESRGNVLLQPTWQQYVEVIPTLSSISRHLPIADAALVVGSRRRRRRHSPTHRLHYLARTLLSSRKADDETRRASAQTQRRSLHHFYLLLVRLRTPFIAINTHVFQCLAGRVLLRQRAGQSRHRTSDWCDARCDHEHGTGTCLCSRQSLPLYCRHKAS